MPEEVQNPDQQTPPEETSKKKPHKINWLHVLIGVIFGAILLGTGFGVYLLTQSKEETTTTPTKVSTSSAQQATPSATATPSVKKNETADWKQVTSSQVGVEFKVPSNWTIKEGDGIPETGENANVQAKAPNDEATLSIYRKPNLDWNNPFISREEAVEVSGVKSKSIYYNEFKADGTSGEEAFWIVVNNSGDLLQSNGVKYWIQGGWEAGNTDLLSTLNKILSTFKFLD